MKKEVADLLSYLDSSDTEEKSAAIADIALLLKMNTFILNGANIATMEEEFKKFLDEELLSIRLSIEEQKEIVDELIERICAKDELSSSMFWAIGKSHASVGFPRLTEVIKRYWKTFDDKTSYQSMIALENFIDHYYNRSLMEKLLPMDEEIMDFVRIKSESSNEKVAELANRILNGLC